MNDEMLGDQRADAAALADALPEPERYELWADFQEMLEPSRRDFLRITGSGVVIALLLGDTALREATAQRPRPGGRLPREIGAWLHIGQDGAVTVYTGKAEIGQNIRTSLTQVVAEELHAPLGRIQLVMADTGRTPYDMGTFGSQTTPQMASQLRRVAAAAREVLLDLAAQRGAAERWGVGRDGLTVADGRVAGPGGRPFFTFGELTRGERIVRLIDEQAPTTAAARWTVAGTSVPKVDGRAFVTGAHRFASDVKRPNMLIGKVLRPPSIGARLLEVQTGEAEALRGVRVVRDGDFVGVTASTEVAADQALAAVQARWREIDQASADILFRHLREHPAAAGGFGGRGGGERGSVRDGLRAADRRLEATYQIAYIAHVPLEPRAAVAEWADGRLTVWTGTQRPFGVRDELARTLSLDTDRVRVIVPDTGSGYGGKHTGEAAVEAARLARAAGRPVRLVWTREEEFRWAYFRPAGVIDLTAGAARDGTLTAWECHNYNSGGAALRTPYAVANERAAFHPCESPLRQGSYRALGATANIFARESHMDDLAQALGLDPLAFRLRNLPDGRLRAVVEAAARRFGWGTARPAPGHGFGLGCGTEKGSYVAACAEVAIDRPAGRVRVVKLVTAFECGAVLNPDHLRNQVEGAAIMGLGGALFEAIDFGGGRIRNPRFSSYRVPRFGDVPELDTVLLDRRDLPSAGAGETPLVAVAPAVGNAIFHATGQRLRSLPMVPRGLPPAPQPQGRARP
jgi:isoquinoline 1-oxidoreductase